jgi:hypothetical protein
MHSSVIGGASNQAIKRVNLTHQMPLAQAANGWVARHRTDHMLVKADQSGPQTHACSNRRRLCPCVAATYNNDVEIGRHASRIYEECPLVKKE